MRVHALRQLPEELYRVEPEISDLDVLGTMSCQRKCFGAIKGKVKSGPMTYFRASTDDRLGVIKGYVGEGSSPTIRSPWTAASQ